MILERCEQKWPDGPPMWKRDEPFQPPKDPVTQEQLDQLRALVKNIAEGKVIVKKAPKSERQELQEVQSKGMKAKVIDRKAEAANDK